jgi:serine/threonine protein kinase
VVAVMAVRDVPGLLAGRYQLGREVGSGATGVVFEAVDRLLGRRVAVKVPFAQLAGDPVFVQRFRQEARSAARLSHPNVVAVFDTGCDDEAGVEYLVMEFVEGCTLRQALAAGPLPAQRAARIAAEICAGLRAAHAAGLVHRDVKPGNVMLGPADQVKVADFGVARAVDAARLTRPGRVVATVQYASPEQLQGWEVDARSDLYSMGCCLYEMLTGSPPFTGADPVSTAYRHVHERPTPLRELDPLLPAALAAVTGRALEKDPARRYQSAAEMAGDLTRVLAGEPAAAADPGTVPIDTDRADPPSADLDESAPTTAGRSGRPRRWRTIVLTVAAFTAGVGLTLWTLAAPPPAPSPTATQTHDTIRPADLQHLLADFGSTFTPTGREGPFDLNTLHRFFGPDSQKDSPQLEAAGFRRGYARSLHAADGEVLTIAAMEFRSPKAAQAVQSWFGICGRQKGVTFSVEGIPGATGQACDDAGGQRVQEIMFTDGPILYKVKLERIREPQSTTRVNGLAIVQARKASK